MMLHLTTSLKLHLTLQEMQGHYLVGPDSQGFVLYDSNPKLSILPGRGIYLPKPKIQKTTYSGGEKKHKGNPGSHLSFAFLTLKK